MPIYNCNTLKLNNEGFKMDLDFAIATIKTQQTQTHLKLVCSHPLTVCHTSQVDTTRFKEVGNPSLLHAY